MKTLLTRTSPPAHPLSGDHSGLRVPASLRLTFRPLPAYARHLDLDPLIWLARYAQRSVVSFDLETTTFVNDPNWTFGIIEFGAVVIDPDGSVSVASLLIDPQCAIDPAASAKNGIHADDLVGAPTFPQVVEEIRSLLERAIAGGHYITSFDIPGLNRECERYGLRQITIDAFDIRALIPKVDMTFKSKKLFDIAAVLQVRIEAPKHRAEPDAIVAAGILAQIVARIGVERFLTPETMASRLTRWMCRACRQLRKRFGK